MKYKILFLFLFAIPAILQSQTLFSKHSSDYKIVIPAFPSDIESFAATEFQSFVFKCSGVSLQIVKENQLQINDSLLVLIGATERAKTVLTDIDSIRNDGFIIHSTETQLFLYGTQEKACLYAVYDFFEQELGFRLFTPDAMLVPTLESYSLKPFHRLENPSFSYRETLYYYPNNSELYANWHRLHNREDMKRNWGMFVHTFQHLIPVNKYFDGHPEWFSEINGKRVRDGQLCLSNPEVLDTLCKNLEDMMKQKPDATIWSVSNNDNYNNCTCAQCRHFDSLYGSPSGTLVYFVNQVAARFSDKIISTLAYQYTRSAPMRNIKPADNVNIMFCSIECGRQEAIATAPGEASFRKDMEDWSRLTHNIFLWDYVGQFRNMMNPFPNLHVLQPNLQFFKQHGVDMMFEQGTGENNITSWMELRTYLLAKLMWNVDVNVDSVFKDFCGGYYGVAAGPIMKFYREMVSSLVESGERLDIYGYAMNGKDGYLSPKQISKYQMYIQLAYELAEGNSVIIDRIRYLELSLDYAILELSLNNVSPEMSFFITDENGQREINQNMMLKAEKFVQDCNRFGATNLEENGYKPEEFKAIIDHYVEKNTGINLAKNKSALLSPSSAKIYGGGTEEMLTDGMTGVLNYNYNWLGIEGSDMETEVDLEKVQQIDEIAVDFYFYPLSWIFLPSKVEFFVSNTGKKWTKVGEQLGDNPQLLAKAMVKTYSVENIQIRARYVKIVAHSLHVNPAWHRGAGQPCWIFADEIIVR